MLIEGRNAIREALKSNLTIEKVMVERNAHASLGKVLADCKARGLKVVNVEKQVLDKLSESRNHQGIIAVATDYAYAEVDDILNANPGEDKLIIILDGISDPHNLGAIVRIADSVNANGIIISKHRSCGVTDTVMRVSSGAAAYVKIAKTGSINEMIRQFKEQNIWVYCADMDGKSVYDTDLKGNIAIVIGSEGEGVSPLTKKLCDGIVSLPQKGKINSLNASVAAGAVLYEALRQRR